MAGTVKSGADGKTRAATSTVSPPPLDTQKHIGLQGGQAFETDGSARQPSRAGDAPTLDIGICHEVGPTRSGLGAVRWHAHLQAQPQGLAKRGNLPHHVPARRPGRTKFEIGGTHLVRRGDARCEGRKQKAQQQHANPHGRGAPAPVGSSTLTV